MICIVAIWLRTSNRLSALQHDGTMAAKKTGARKSGYVPRKVAEEIKKRGKGACVPPDIRRPWDVFHQDVLYYIEEDNDISDKSLLAYQEDLHAVQELGALRAFQALPQCRQRAYAEVSLQELSAFAAWSNTCGLADAMERVAAWTDLDVDVKANHVPRNWRALLAKHPTWHVLIADDMRNNSLLAADGDVSSLVAGACAAGAIVLRGGRVMIATRPRGGGRKSTPGAADDNKNLHKPVGKRPAHRPQGQTRVGALDAKYPWGREGGPPPASETEQRSLAEQMVRLRIEAGNFARPERADGKRLAHADKMLAIMRGKARAGFGGGLALATRGLDLNRSAGVALAKRARKLALDLKAHFDPEGAPSVLIEEGLALWDAPAD